MGVEIVNFNPFEGGMPDQGAARDGALADPASASAVPGGHAGSTSTASSGSTGSGKKSKDGKPEISAAARDELMRVLMPGSKLAPNEDPQGFARSVKEVGTQLRQKALETRQPFYEEAYRSGVDGFDAGELATNPLFAIAMQRAERTMTDRAMVPGSFTTGSDGPNGKTLEYWDMVRQRLDDMHGNAKAAGSLRAEEIDALRQELRGKLNSKFPKYASARGAAELFFNASDPFEAGVKFSRGRYSLDGASQAIAAMSGEEKKLFTEGFASAFVEDIRAAPDRDAALNRINAGETGRNKVRIALGAKADQLEAFLRLEGLIGTTQSDDPARALAELMVQGSAQTETPVDRRVAEHIAGMLTSKNPDIFLTGLKQAAKPNVLEGLRQLGAGSAENASTEDPVIAKARDAVARGADRTAVMKRLQDNGIPPKGV